MLAFIFMVNGLWFFLLPFLLFCFKLKHLFLQDITSKWAEVRQLVPQRDGTLQQELRKQQNNELMRRQFAEKANAVGPWIERQMDAVVSIAMGMQVRFLNF